jgi:hypothetical protein
MGRVPDRIFCEITGYVQAFRDVNKMEQRPIFLYLVRKGLSPLAIHDDLVTTLGADGDAGSYSSVIRYLRDAVFASSNPPTLLPVTFCHFSLMFLDDFHIPLNTAPFTFVINESEFQLNQLEAALLSPYVLDHMLVDGTSNRFTISSTSFSADDFDTLRQIVCSNTPVVTSTQSRSLLCLSRSLGNPGLQSLSLLHSLNKSDPLASGVSAAACEFHRFQRKDLMAIDFDTLNSILSDSELEILSEDELLNVELELFGIDPVCFLSRDKIGDLSLSLPFSELSETIWTTFLARYILCDLTIPLDSVIVKELPALFSDFRGKHLKLLYRESRDFGGHYAFHKACDGHRNTLAIVMHSNGSIFGGFTPLPWASSGGWIKDPSCQTFLFTLQNPFNIPPMRFPIRPDAARAIFCDSTTLCVFAYGYTWQSFDASALGDFPLQGLKFMTGEDVITWTNFEIFEVMDGPS